MVRIGDVAPGFDLNADNRFTRLGEALSFDGRYVAFFSNATNLVAGDTNGKSDVFLHNMKAETAIKLGIGFEVPTHAFLPQRLAAVLEVLDGRRLPPPTATAIGLKVFLEPPPVPGAAPTASWFRSSSTRPSSRQPRTWRAIRAPGMPTLPR